MRPDPETSTPDDAAVMLRKYDINPTSQRLEIARMLFARCQHLSAEDVYSLLQSAGSRVSKATVYNTLGLFATRGLIREVIADPARVFYDPNTVPHHHFYDVVTGRLMDIPADKVQLGSLPELPEGMRMEGVDVIFRIRSTVNTSA
jgi:Fur family iron response transcriptional regulator